jgi:hypothetical protein
MEQGLFGLLRLVVVERLPMLQPSTTQAPVLLQEQPSMDR